MSKYNFDEIVDRRNRGSYKWDVKDNELPMWIADMDFHVLPEIKEAIIKRLDIDAYGYAECPKEYFESYQAWAKKNHDVDLDTKWMVFSSGVVASIDSVFKHLIPTGSGVVIMSPVYHVFYHCIENNGLKVVENQLIYQNGEYKIDFQNLEKLLSDENNKVLLLCNPHNPVGRIWNEQELAKIVAFCEKFNVLLISDEIHCDITKPGIPYNPIMKFSKNAIALMSPTKVFNIAGIQTSVAICPNDALRAKISNGFGMDDIGEPNYIASYATIAAFTYGQKWHEEMREYVFNNKKFIQEYIERELPQLRLIDNDATYLLWIDISHYSKDSDTFTKELRNKTGLFVSSGKQFGTGGNGFIRVNVATSLANVKDACERLKSYIKSL